MERKLAEENALAVKAAADRAALAELYRRFFPRVYNFIFAHVKDAALADDLTSDVFEKMLRALKNYDPARAAFSTWITRIAMNRVTDYYRSAKFKKEAPWEEFFDAESGAPSPESEALRRDGQEGVLRALDKLSERERGILMLKYWAELGNDEIAVLLSLTPNHVGVLAHRAALKLRKMIEKENEM